MIRPSSRWIYQKWNKVMTRRERRKFFLHPHLGILVRRFTNIPYCREKSIYHRGRRRSKKNQLRIAQKNIDGWAMKIYCLLEFPPGHGVYKIKCCCCGEHWQYLRAAKISQVYCGTHPSSWPWTTQSPDLACLEFCLGFIGASLPKYRSAVADVPGFAEWGCIGRTVK